MWNGFVSITKHVPVVNRFFSFTPDFLADTIDYEDLDAGQALGEALGQVYGFSQGVPIDPFDDTKSLYYKHPYIKHIVFNHFVCFI